MTTKPPSGINYAGEENFDKRIYSAVDELIDIIPVNNDRYRLSFCLTMYFKNEIENLLDAIDQANPSSSKIGYVELEKKLNTIFEERHIKKVK